MEIDTSIELESIPFSEYGAPAAPSHLWVVEVRGRRKVVVLCSGLLGGSGVGTLSFVVCCRFVGGVSEREVDGGCNVFI